jgi:hypothetical protein
MQALMSALRWSLLAPEPVAKDEGVSTITPDARPIKN